MKNYLVLFMLSLMLIISSCEKAQRLENKLDGTWELRYLIGFLPPELRGDRPPGNGYIYSFQGNNFERRMGGKLVDSGTFSVLKDSSNNNNEKLDYKLVLDGDKYDHSIPFKLSDEKLTLHFGALASDGAIGTYAKIGESYKM
jgi:hypothetical protein